MNKDNYAPGTYNDPRAPWNQPDPIEDSDEFQDKKAEMWDENILDIPYMLEALGERDDKDLKMLAKTIRDNGNGIHNIAIGAWVTKWVTEYTEPSDEEVIEELNEEPYDPEA